MSFKPKHPGQERGNRAYDPNHARGDGKLHRKDDRGQYRARPKPGPNDPCECNSGKKAKKCHPDGLRPIVNRVENGHPCELCGAKERPTIPLKHEGLPGWVKRLCMDCVRAPNAAKDLIAKEFPNGPPGAPKQDHVSVGTDPQTEPSQSLNPADEATPAVADGAVSRGTEATP